MPRYLVERTLPEGLPHAAGAEGANACRGVIERDGLEGVTWVHSYMNEDRTRVVSVYDAPSPEAVRKAAVDDLPADAITEIRVPEDA
jgi:hypothetical protein